MPEKKSPNLNGTTPPSPAPTADDPRHRGAFHGDVDDQLMLVRSIIDVLAAKNLEPAPQDESVRCVLYLALDTLDAAIEQLEEEAQHAHQAQQARGKEGQA